MTNTVVTRFAPSPTGFLHIGGARTALFNWLYARHCDGQMLLRIEDTDRERYNREAVDAIADGLTWLGIDWHGDPISQYARRERHAEVAHKLVEDGKAYRCYASPEELSEMRERATREGRSSGYDGRWRDRDPSEAPDGISPVIRIKMPVDGDTLISDQVQGDVRFPNKDLDDFVILRSDGTPTYMLAVVVDDHDMGVTHVIRGDDHLTNAARQTGIYQALGWAVPIWAHIPLIHGPDGAKLSKRHGALGVEAYRAMGYLPQALCNYLARLGWAHGDDEIFSMDQAADWFDFDGIGKGAARFDFAKLANLNGHYIRESDDHALVEAIAAILPDIEGGSAFGTEFTGDARRKLLDLMPALKQRAKTLLDIVNSAEFLVTSRPLTLNEKASILLDDAALGTLSALSNHLEGSAWDREALDEHIRQFCDDSGLKFGKVAQPLRAALTGTTTAPGITDILIALGKEESLGRISDQTR